MEIILPLALSLAITYVIGAIPTAYIFGRVLKGLDIRQHGSGNVGATNAFRVLGKGPGTVVLLIDIIKGVIPTTIVANMFGLTEPWMMVVLGLTAVAAHNWTVFLQFKGGKGIATSLGVLIGLTIQIAGIRPVLLSTIGVWLGLFLTFGYVSLASMVAAVAMPIFMVMFNAPFVIIFMSIVLCLFIVFRHRTNLQRLLKGQEHRVKFLFHK